MTPIRSGGVIAAGEGSRLKSLGIPKPLVPVAGEPLIAHVLGHFQAAGIARAAVVFNAEEADCADYVRHRFGGLVETVRLENTGSSYGSLLRILDIAPPGRLLVSTVDAFCPREDFVRFVREAERADEEEIVLAVTPFVDDEKPLWVRLGPDGNVSALGGDSGDAVTAGIYVFPERLRDICAARRRDASPGRSHARLRDFLISLREAGEPMRAVSLPKVVDVDRATDLRSAEELARATVPRDPRPVGGASR